MPQPPIQTVELSRPCGAAVGISELLCAGLDTIRNIGILTAAQRTIETQRPERKMVSMKSKLHPALELFKELFDKESASDPIVMPTYFVPRGVFHSECLKRGIDHPENFIAAAQWEEEIGLPDFAHRIIKAYHKAHGSDFTPMEKGAWRLRQKTLQAKCDGCGKLLFGKRFAGLPHLCKACRKAHNSERSEPPTL